jgi:hypothetical protein
MLPATAAAIAPTISGRHSICVGEDFDPSGLFGCVGPVGSGVEPEKQRVAEIVELRAGCRVVEVDHRDRFA